MDAHLFGPRVPVQAGSRYTVGTYVDASRLTQGSVGFYVDEWDAAGTWVSGKYIRDVPSFPRRRIEQVAFGYVPTSAVVETASLQIILSPGAAGTAYVDEVWWALGAVP